MNRRLSASGNSASGSSLMASLSSTHRGRRFGSFLDPVSSAVVLLSDTSVRERRCQCDQILKSKVAKNFPKVTQKVSTTVFTQKGKKSPNVTKHLSYFCREIYPAKKIVQSSPTASNVSVDLCMDLSSRRI